MKCKHCDGTGRRMEESDNGIGWIPVKCEYCNGTGKVEVTNEEWFCTLSTEEKADWLWRKCNWASMFGPIEKEWLVEWLKAVHEENEK